MRFYSEQGKAFAIKKPPYEYPAFDGIPNRGIIHTLNFNSLDDISLRNDLVWPEGVDLKPYLAMLPQGRYRFNVRVMQYINNETQAMAFMPAHNDVCSYTLPVIQSVSHNATAGEYEHTVFEPALHHGYLSPDFKADAEMHSGMAYSDAMRLFVVVFATDDKARFKTLDKGRVYACPNVARYIGTEHPLGQVYAKPNAKYGDFTAALFNYPMVFRKHANRFSPLYRKQKRLTTV
jgi:hypothetical protein